MAFGSRIGDTDLAPKDTSFADIGGAIRCWVG